MKILIATLIFLFGGGLISLALMSAGNPKAQIHRFSIDLLTSGQEPVKGATVQVVGSSNSNVLVTDNNGQTPWTPHDLSLGIEITVADTGTPEGVALGFQRVVGAGQVSAGPDAEIWWSHGTSMPVAVRHVIAGEPGQNVTMLPGNYAYPHWMILVPELSSGLRFGAAIAPLIEGVTVAGYAAYRGVIVSEDYYDNGLAMIVPNVDLGDDGFLLTIDLLGALSGGSVLEYDAYNFTNSSSPSVGFEVDYLWTVDDRAHFRVSGQLQAGQFALLLRDNEDGPSQTISVQDSTPNITIPPTGGFEFASLDSAEVNQQVTGVPSTMEPGGTEVLVQDCVPAAPADPDPWTCQAQAPNPNNCPDPALLISEECQVTVTKTPVVCLNPGSTFELTQARTARFVVEFAMTGGEGTPLFSEGGLQIGYESEEVTVNAWTAGPGDHGLGECNRWFRKYLSCVQKFKIKIDGVDVSPDGGSGMQECVHDFETVAACKDLIVTENSCSRKPD